MARTRVFGRIGGKSPRYAGKGPRGKSVGIRKKRRFRELFRRIKICKTVPIKSREASLYLNKLRRRQRRSYGQAIKVPGYRHKYIMHQGLRRRARRSSGHRKRILRRLARYHKQGKSVHGIR